MIPKNTSVIVSRKPGTRAGGILSQYAMARKNERYAEPRLVQGGQNPQSVQSALAASTAGSIPTTVEGTDEEDRIANVIDRSGDGFERTAFQKFPFRGGGGGRGGLDHSAMGGQGKDLFIAYCCSYWRRLGEILLF